MNGATGMPAAGAQLRLMPREWTATVIMPNVQADADVLVGDVVEIVETDP